GTYVWPRAANHVFHQLWTLLMSPTIRQSSRLLASAPVRQSCASAELPPVPPDTRVPSSGCSAPDSPPPPEMKLTRSQMTRPTRPSPPPPTANPPPGRPSIGPLPRSSSTCEGSRLAPVRNRTIGS